MGFAVVSVWAFTEAVSSNNAALAMIAVFFILMSILSVDTWVRPYSFKYCARIDFWAQMGRKYFEDSVILRRKASFSAHFRLTPSFITF
jgi:hypothetical protein